MNHRHRKVLHALFAHPLGANIDFKEVEAMLRELGAEIDDRAHARVSVTLNGKTAAFHHARHSLPKEEVMSVRHFLETCGIDPTARPV